MHDSIAAGAEARSVPSAGAPAPWRRFLGLRPGAFRELLIPLLVFLCGAGLSVSLALVQKREIRRDAVGRVEHLADKLENEILVRLRVPEYGMRGEMAAFVLHPDMRREDFRRYVQARDIRREFPGVRGFGYIERIERDGIPGFVARERADGMPGFSLRTAGEDPDLYVVRFVEPLSQNGPALGYDIGSEPVRRQAAEAAVRNAEPTMTGRISLVQDGRKRPGVLFMIPFYRDATTPPPERRERDLVGLVYVPIVFQELLDGLGRAADGKLDFALYDGTEDTLSLLYREESPGARDPDLNEGLRRVLHVGGRDVLLRARATRDFEKETDWATPLLVGVGGSLLSALLGLFVRMVMGSRRRALLLAEGMTVELRESERRARAALRESQELRSTVMESAVVSVTDEHGRITEVNDAFCALVGYSREELLGRTHRVVRSGIHDDAFWKGMWETVTQGRSWRGEICNRARDGSLHWLDSLIAPFASEDGRIEKFVSVRFDVTARRAMEEEMLSTGRLLRSILDSATNSGIVVTNPHGIVTLFNKGAEILLGYRAEEVLSLATPILWHLRSEVEARERELGAALGRPVRGFEVFVQSLRAGVRETRRWTMRDKEGREFPVQLSVTVIVDGTGKVVGYLGIFQDISRDPGILPRLESVRDPEA
jgi:PAS domain S-box-containing protein